MGGNPRPPHEFSHPPGLMGFPAAALDSGALMQTQTSYEGGHCGQVAGARARKQLGVGVYSGS